jgi:hypothetical protein
MQIVFLQMIVHIQQRVECVVIWKQILVHHLAVVVGVVAIIIIPGIPVAPAPLVDGQLGLPLSLDFVGCGNELALPRADCQPAEGSILERTIVWHIWNKLAVSWSFSGTVVNCSGSGASSNLMQF